MQPSEYDILREVEALRDIRRRSTTPGALTIDPDLPNQAPTSPTNPYNPQDASTSANPSPDAVSKPSDDPFHLFWVPASLHPEIAPQEFRAFLKEHARNPPSDDESQSLYRRPSNASSGLGRKKSMLSRQYQPSENDSSDEAVVPLRRNNSGIYSSNQNLGPQLTIADLQKLDELAEEASESDDPAQLRSILRRSLSLNVSPSALDADDLGDEADQPIVVAPPGQFLRRTARTRIRKPGLPGDGGGHRFNERRRGPSSRSKASPTLQRTSSDVSSSDHGDSSESFSNSMPTPRPRAASNEGMLTGAQRPDSFSEEALIYEAYARDHDEEEEEEDVPPLPPVVITASPSAGGADYEEPAPASAFQSEPEPPSILYQPQPTRLSAPSGSDTYQAQQPGSRTPSPSSEYEVSTPTVSPETYSPAGTPTGSPPPPPSFLSTSPSPRKDKDKKGLFKWGSDKEKEKPAKGSKRVEKEREKDKDSGFFGSLFGKKKHDSSVPEPAGLHGGREAAHALLGQSQRAPRSPGAPSPLAGVPDAMLGGINNYSRYPIHVERAIYRLSHIKLANPRRPLYEQVLISNLMFWYLGVINKAQAQAQEQQQAAQAEEDESEAEREAAERERLERERQEKEQRERAEREQREREEMKKREASPRRGSLTKAVPPGAPQQRRAEMPVRGPQYEMQHRVMEKEYAGYNGNGPARTSSAGAQQHGYYSPGESMQQQQRLPPGAMAPADHSSWQASPRTQSASPPPAAQRRSRSPPPPNMYNAAGGQGGGARLAGRSLSATAAMPSAAQPPPMNGKIRKGQSAHAGVPANARRPQPANGAPIGEEEDMPLAMWQRQQRR
ncbi:unnamed protein product [Mycena citricolor]|uniref:Protein Zds1 C-terminal domain-containing protein n=1 Tax=Mycena citricolor TaxID=2018698 RepID=A0AAD2H1Q5_9AGAR|nr:unnamed protein product [Mycena citricolor]